LLGFVAFAVVIGFGTWRALVPRNDSRLEAIRKDGYPLTLADLDAWYLRIPDSENAALIYTNAFYLLSAIDTRNAATNLIGDIPLLREGQPISPDDRAKLTSLLASNRAALDLIHSAGELAQSRYPIDLKQGANTLLPDLAKAKSAVLILTAQAYLHSIDGNPQGVTESFVAAGRVADSFAAEPLVISSLVRMACWNIIVKRLQLVLNNTSLTEDQLIVLEKLFAKAEQPWALARSLAGERALALSFANDPLSSRRTRSPQETTARKRTGMGSGLYKLVGFAKKDQAFLLDVMITNIAAAELPYPERFQSSKPAAASMLARPSRFYILSSAFLPALAGVYEKDADHTARVRVARTALAVERYRRSHGNVVPESLEKLVTGILEEVPKDPIDGQMLRFRKAGFGYAIYSIGLDEMDDGGNEFDPNNTKGGRDITFIVEH